jgi:hypothetical protein
LVDQKQLVVLLVQSITLETGSFFDSNCNTIYFAKIRALGIVERGVVLNSN